MTTTGSAKIDKIIADARALGLTVEVEVTDEPWYDGSTRRNVAVTVERPKVEARTVLDVVNNGERVHAAWGWNPGPGQRPHLYFARKSGVYVDARPLTASVLPYAIRGLVD